MQWLEVRPVCVFKQESWEQDGRQGYLIKFEKLQD
jgi:hypothetical protein